MMGKMKRLQMEAFRCITVYCTVTPEVANSLES